MNWQDFLTQRGGEFKNDILVSFGATKKESHLVNTGTIIAPLTQFSILKISGADASDFLQNQLSNDVKQLSDTKAQHTSWCTHQGKIIATLFLIHHQNDFYALVTNDLVDKLLARLQLFVLRSNVKIDHIKNWVAMEIYGDNALQYLPELPEKINQQSITNKAIFIRTLGKKPRGLIVANNENMMEIWQQLDVNCVPIGADAWSLINIKTGIAQINADNSELFVPHPLNFTKIPMVDFNKGCYPGQEVVARMQYLGTNKYSTYHIIINRDTCLKSSSKLDAKNSGSLKGAGKIIQSIINGDGQLEGLATLQNTLVKTNQEIFDVDNNLVTINKIIY